MYEDGKGAALSGMDPDTVAPWDWKFGIDMAPRAAHLSPFGFFVLASMVISGLTCAKPWVERSEHLDPPGLFFHPQLDMRHMLFVSDVPVNI